MLFNIIDHIFRAGPTSAGYFNGDKEGKCVNAYAFAFGLFFLFCFWVVGFF